MTVPSIGDISRELESDRRASDFTALARHVVAIHHDGLQGAALRAEGTASSRVVSVLRSAVATGSTASWSQLLPYRSASSSWLAALQSESVFDRIVGETVRIPMNELVVVVTSHPTAGLVNELSIKPISEVGLDNVQLDSQKVAGTVIISSELSRFASPASTLMFDGMLRKSVARATDSLFLSTLIGATTPVNSSGNSPTSFQSDLFAMLSSMSYGSNARLYAVLEPARCLELSAMIGSGGMPAYPNMTPLGGSVMGVTVLASDQLPGNTAVAFDATQLIANSGDLLIDSASHADVTMNTAPDSPATQSTIRISLWQHGLRGIRCERFFGVKVARATSVASATAVNY